MNYSTEFQKLINEPAKLKQLLEGCSFTGTFEAWQKRKTFISKAIDKNGSFLDVGCGNGFLLRCLQEWSAYNIDPFGIDINENYITQAKQLFTSCSDHFEDLDIASIEAIYKVLPASYDFVYYSRDWTAGDIGIRDKDLIEKLIKLTKSGGRTIVGFYGEDQVRNQKSITELQNMGVNFKEVLVNPAGTNLVAWV